jgi:hypothetical protein
MPASAGPAIAELKQVLQAFFGMSQVVVGLVQLRVVPLSRTLFEVARGMHAIRVDLSTEGKKLFL